MPARSAADNPLALAVMGLLLEKPMHPYEMMSTLRERGLDSAFKLSTGTLYDTVRALLRDDRIRDAGTGSDGNRPQRTVYALTDTGRTAFTERLDALIRVPADDEYPKFVSAVAYIGALGAEAAAGALTERADRLAERAERLRSGLDSALGESGLPRLFMIEVEYALHMIAAEREWVLATAEELRSGALPHPEEHR
ncbi:PadR family transcriptional regulator [Nocardiopsis sp. RSe5-2]|uniref:PadR family transcriptional regulator n=1 Tax=Nocardiopsis endophytica TaxID=3018445 RepID=A0ABT4U3H5_9ACTN|nr:PadR family transcriptional regulator [Nocardiopsis endophytica]MDA2811511.1 PadR family transcriptional regulator [Nocardiopsis endophytica]